MDFSFNDQEAAFAEAVRRYARDRLRPDYALWDRGTPYPRERMLELAELGITGLRVPAAYGGSEASYVLAGIAAEELARGDYNVTLFLQITMIAADIVAGHASEAMKREWLPALGAGQVADDLRLRQEEAELAGDHAGMVQLLAERSRLSALSARGGLGDLLVFSARKG